MRYSKQREEILKVIINSDDHPTAKAIYERVRKTIPNVSLGTVYRNLGYLVDNNEIRKIQIENSNDRFDRNIVNHNHIYCECCNKVMDFDYDLSNGAVQNLEKKTCFKIIDYNFNIKGICNNCMKERK